MTKDGFIFLVMGFTGKYAAKFKESYINAFNQIEEYLKKSNGSYDDLVQKLRIEKEKVKVYSEFFHFTLSHTGKIIDIAKRYRASFVKSKKEAGQWKYLYYHRNDLQNVLDPLFGKFNQTITKIDKLIIY